MCVWHEIKDKKFFSATARERAVGLVDKDTFTEFLGPIDRFSSPHLPALGEAIAFDDGVVTGLGLIGRRPVFVISQEGRFIGGAVGEVGGAKMAALIKLALESYDQIKQEKPDAGEEVLPVVVISFETGGVRLQEANAGLLAHAEMMDLLQDARGRLPIIGLIGSRIGCFGGMGFIAAAADVIVMSEYGRIGLTGPEVIEQEMGKKEFDASDRALVFRTMGGKHRYIMGDSSFLVEDSLSAFRQKLTEILQTPLAELQRFRQIGTPELVQGQLDLISLAVESKARDAMDFWKIFGNERPESLPDMKLDEFLRAARRRVGN
jgi:biotin-independent malonate decarboxylase beta subunit